MPIPFILGGIAVIAGVAGVKKGIDAKNYADEAKEVNREAKRIAEEAELIITSAKNNTKSAIEELGRKKIDILCTTITEFVTEFEKIKNIQLVESEGIDELKGYSYCIMIPENKTDKTVQIS